MTTDQLYQQAMQCHQSGKLAEAQALYRQVLALEPNHGDAWHMLAGLAHQSGDNAAALASVRRAIDANPSVAIYHASHGLILSAMEQPDDAIDAYRQALRLDSNLAGAHTNLGNLLKDKAQWSEAIAEYRAALTLRPDHPPTLHNLGLALKHEDKLLEAIDAFRRAVQLAPELIDSRLQLSESLREAKRVDEAIAEACRALAQKPDSAPAHTSLGLALQESNRLDEAIVEYRQAIALDPKYTAPYTNLGVALETRRESAQAIALLRKAAELEPDAAPVHQNLANSLLSLGEFDEARKELDTALALKGEFPEALTTLGKLQTELGQLDEGIASYERAVALRPKFAEPTWNWSINLLLRGDFEHGLPKFEARRKVKAFRADRGLSGQMWDGRAIEGKRILLHWEQGLGDTIHFVRYAKILKERAAGVSLLCQPTLKRLLTGQCGLETVVGDSEPLPAYDFYCPLPSLPLLLKTTLQTIPADVPYLFPEPPLVEKWKELLAQEPRRKVGLVWAGNPQHQNDRNRSIRLEDLAPLTSASGAPTGGSRDPDAFSDGGSPPVRAPAALARFYSLQKGPAAEQAKSPPAGMEVVDWTERLTDWAETAALITCLDLVITVDTAVAHLAGAMGKPVWVLLPFIPDWRWMLEREDSPWYPTMRLFRQPTRGDWRTPIQRIAADLQKL